MLAYEVAVQFRAAGEDVPLVLLAHATNPTERYRIGAIKLALGKLRYHLNQLHRQPAGERWRYLRERIQGVGAAVGLQTADLDENALRLRANELSVQSDGTLAMRPTERREEIPCGLVFRSIGYQVAPLAGVPPRDCQGMISGSL